MDPTEYGWIKDEATKSLVPTTSLAPQSILKLIKCSCASVDLSKSLRCVCHQAKLSCTMLCACINSTCMNEHTIQAENIDDFE